MNAATQAVAQSASSAASSTHQSPAHNPAPQPDPMAGQSASTDAFLRDFTLVAEAAKRAQMAVMMRDFESIGL